MARAREYDLVVAGGGPAGCAAAISGCRRGLRVVVLEQAAKPRAAACCGWVGPAAGRVCRELGVDVETLGTAFSGLRLWSGELAEQVAVDGAELHGWLVAPERLSAALLRAVEQAGAVLVRPCELARVRLGERAAEIGLVNGEEICGAVLVIADGAGSATARLAKVAAATGNGSAGQAARAVLPARNAGVGLDVVIGAGRSLRLTMIARRNSEIRVGLVTHDLTVPATAQLGTVLNAAQRAGLVPEGPWSATETPCLAGVALEFDAHVGKRSLLAGDAGGFVSTFSGDGLYPALRSGMLAAETAADALGSSVMQDELAQYSARWRAALAEYLRMPNTDLGLLLPMVFGNAQIARRVARAFVLGQSF